MTNGIRKWWRHLHANDRALYRAALLMLACFAAAALSGWALDSTAIAAFFTLSGMILLFVGVALPDRIYPKHQCPNCGYDVRATKNRCPECGTAIQRRKQ